MKQCLLAGCALGVASVVAACAPPTQIELRLETDIPCSAFTGFTVTAGAPGEVETRAASTEATLCDHGRLGALVLVPSAERDARVAIKVVGARSVDVTQCTPPDYGKGLTGGGCLVARRELRFIPNASLILPVTLREDCLNVPCDGGTTCVTGKCEPATIEDPSRCVNEGACTDLALFGGETTNAKRVFLTSTTFDGALGGLSGADAKCQALADGAQLGGTFKAWLSTDAASPSTRFSKVGPWALVDGTRVADGWAALTSGTLAHSIDLDEHGTAPATTSVCGATEHAVWSETNSDGTFYHATETDPSNPRFDCADWTGAAANAHVTWGDATATDARWTAYPNCNTFGSVCVAKLAHLYCFEQ